MDLLQSVAFHVPTLREGRPFPTETTSWPLNKKNMNISVYARFTALMVSTSPDANGSVKYACV